MINDSFADRTGCETVGNGHRIERQKNKVRGNENVMVDLKKTREGQLDRN